MPGLVDHLEQLLGRVKGGWTKGYDGRPMPFQIVECAGGVLTDTTCYATLGLSNFPLGASATTKAIRHELLMLSRTGSSMGVCPSILQQVGCEAINRDLPYLRGDVIGPRGLLFDGSSMEALYVAPPNYYPDSFAVYEEAGKAPIVMAWLVPITRPEADYVRTRGWSAFEDILVQENPDILDPARPSVV